MFKQNQSLRILYQPYSDFYMEQYDKIPQLKVNPIHNNPYVITKNVCILAGNIGRPFNKNYWELIDHCNRTFHLTILIIGNYELEYSCIIDTVDHIENNISSYQNVVFLHNSSIKLEDKTVIMGSPLWNPSIINETVRGYTANVANSQYRHAINFIKNRLKDCSDYEDIIIITSTPPEKLNYELYKYNIFWVHGKSKANGIKNIGTSELISNQPNLPKYNPKMQFYLNNTA